ncbi:hypothetical protein GCM10009868_23590 [Terrabacter aerolatus]|uniref:AbiEi antitoxin C-terminal domain-containing protein n=1 Tax=Terrabacter aerolatus TaxID=422442 RepID=A0A512D1X4_9MICO|nr:hypothetical protein [Terrabacter aerolatus]GEO30461.1 hypothetical protein TAE01_22710 [Terrabacter aerolatus]
MHLSPELLVLARSQHGVVTRRQLLEAGVTRDALRWRVGRDWRLLLPGVYALQTGLPSERQRLVAAQLAGGDGAWLAGTTAAALHGLRSCSVGAPIRVLVPAPRRSRRIAWVELRSTTLTGEPVVDRDGMRIGCLARAVVDAAAEAPAERQARALVIEAVQPRLVRLDDLEHRVDARGRSGSVRLRRILAEVAAGAWSVPESDLLALIRTSPRLPTPLANQVLTGPTGEKLTSPDAWFDDVGMAVLVQSREFHADGLEGHHGGAGLGPVGGARRRGGVTPAALARDPGAQLRRLERAHDSARRSGRRASVRVVPRPTSPLPMQPTG